MILSTSTEKSFIQTLFSYSPFSPTEPGFEEVAAKVKAYISELFSSFPLSSYDLFKKRLIIIMSERDAKGFSIVEHRIFIFQVVVQQMNTCSSEVPSHLQKPAVPFYIMYDESPILHANIDPETKKILWCNTAFFKRLGYLSRDELLGMTPERFIYDEDHHLAQQTVTLMSQHQEVRNVEIRFKTKEGNPVPVLLNANGLTNDEGIVVSSNSAAVDLTYVSSIRKSILQTKEYIMTVVSHELRTPLQGILGSHEALVEEINQTERLKISLADHFESLIQLVNEEKISQTKEALLSTQELLVQFQQSNLHQYVTLIDECCNHLLGLVNTILDYQKIKEKKITLSEESIDLDHFFASQSFQILKNKGEKKGIQVEYVIHPSLSYSLLGDPLRLSQILINLIDNAIKNTEKGGVITASIELLKEDSSKVSLKFAIKDTGKGISNALLEKIFQPFEQGSINRAQRSEGIGLGLAIAEELIQLMKGSGLSVTSSTDPIKHGTTFTFDLSFRKSHKKERPSSHHLGFISSLTADATRFSVPKWPRVLIVDDTPSIQLAMRFMIQKNKTIQIDTAINGLEALLTILRHQKIPIAKDTYTLEDLPKIKELLSLHCQKGTYFDLILMDWKMPVIDGRDATEILRACNVPVKIIGLSGEADPDSNASFLEKLDGYFVKPIKAKEVESTLLKSLKTKPIQEPHKSSLGLFKSFDKYLYCIVHWKRPISKDLIAGVEAALRLEIERILQEMEETLSKNPPKEITENSLTTETGSILSCSFSSIFQKATSKELEMEKIEFLPIQAEEPNL